MTARPHRSLAATTLAGLALASALAGCSTTDRGSTPALQRQASWAVLPFENHTETPMAGQRAEAIAAALLHARGVGEVKRYAGPAQQDPLFGVPGGASADSGLGWARDQGVAYALTGAVDEWRYKVGVDGEPAAGVTLRIIDVKTGATLWTGAGGKSGWSREALSAVGQKLIRGLLDSGLGNVR
ncbi:penicillin-binding protein activator LpoB [Comamonas terrigena]|jgi:TolB-like protein|uniref:penicillin-binding protein activator LpoB n=1 Tax=Comamonas terrigena TaxID=32013 RepID=UPI0023527A23|nr:penicillin-binding protein activator LpoB [Comamonas terrigena]MDH0047930.1 penicillin-binding protein activator LpoB [Comamonas terrigena]MDH0510470.1 penicillin-binding protein activator LpoB [Comamonas terrigena]MDH1090072.1 penicillin-binding protein activator LpoB [Comamonas terrigena]MDH1290157.1 penicillin-binding protein activator LpoB [Comamonas terrigena]MDH1499944.1 penicillin-binding protein activator LpoB [Comamonas terrigena]